jgi:hypothetical protein
MHARRRKINAEKALAYPDAEDGGSGAPNKALTMVVHDGGRRVEIAVRG